MEYIQVIKTTIQDIRLPDLILCQEEVTVLHHLEDREVAQLILILADLVGVFQDRVSQEAIAQEAHRTDAVAVAVQAVQAE